jgi:hypothetical protein
MENIKTDIKNNNRINNNTDNINNNNIKDEYKKN